MDDDVSSFELIRESLRLKLVQTGFRSVRELRSLKATEYKRDANLTREEAEEIRSALHPRNSIPISSQVSQLSTPASVPAPSSSGAPIWSSASSSSSSMPSLPASTINTLVRDSTPSQTKRQTAMEMLSERSNSKIIISFARELDAMMGGSLPIGSVTEFCGEPGVGKTQLCLQLCVSATMPESLRGFGGEALFIDTECSFHPNRVGNIARGFIENFNRILKKNQKNSASQQQSQRSQTQLADLPTWEKVMDSIHIMRAMDFPDLFASIICLPEFLRQHPKICVIVIDSISAHFRVDWEDQYEQRHRLLSSIGMSLAKVAKQNNIAVVVTNQMTTKIEFNGGESRLEPALGDLWGHNCATRILLKRSDDPTDREKQIRKAVVMKSSHLKLGKAKFVINKDGIRSVQPPPAPAQPQMSSPPPPPPSQIPSSTPSATFDGLGTLPLSSHEEGGQKRARGGL